MTEDRTVYNLMFVQESITVDRICIRTAGTFSGTAVVRLGVYNNSNGLPTTVLFDAGTVSCTASNTPYEITINETIPAGWYWLATNSQTAAATNAFVGTAASYREGLTLVGTNIDVNNRDGRFEDGVTGAFATAGTLGRTDTGVTVFFRKA